MAIISVDPQALRAAAHRLDVTAGLVRSAVSVHLGDLQFDGSTAGRAHGAAGASVRARVETLREGLARWAAAADELAAALRAGAALHDAAEHDAAAALR